MGHKLIPLTRGLFTKVSEQDEEFVSGFNWYALKMGSRFYAARCVGPQGKQVKVFLHRVLAKTPDGLVTDHANMDTLDNTRENLRVCTQTQNARNRAIDKRNTSGFKGAYWDSARKKWHAQITVGGKVMALGRFDSLETAARAYDAAAVKHFGEFARLNFPAVRA